MNRPGSLSRGVDVERGGWERVRVRVIHRGQP